MRFFPLRGKREQNTEGNLPPELKNHYQNSQPQRVSVAWLLALASLLGTVLIMLAIFFGGRWIYRKIAGHNNSGQVATTQTSKPKSAQSTPKPQPKPNNSSSTSPSSNSNQTSPTTKPSTPTNQQKNLANTGPQGTAATFIITSVLGFTAYEFRLRRKTKA